MLHQKLVFPINPRKKTGQYTVSHFPFVQQQAGPAGPPADYPKHYAIEVQRELSRRAQRFNHGLEDKTLSEPLQRKGSSQATVKRQKQTTDHFTGEKSQSDPGRKSEALDFWASTSRQTLEGPVPLVVATALLPQTSDLCMCEGREGDWGVTTQCLPPSVHYL